MLWKLRRTTGERSIWLKDAVDEVRPGEMQLARALANGLGARSRGRLLASAPGDREAMSVVGEVVMAGSRNGGARGGGGEVGKHSTLRRVDSPPRPNATRAGEDVQMSRIQRLDSSRAWNDPDRERPRGGSGRGCSRC